jgi:hypothetical protein
MHRIAVTLLLLAAALGAGNAAGAPQAEPWPRWQAHDPASTLAVDHSPWQRFLERYLDAAHPSGIARVRYGAVAAPDRAALAAYLRDLQAVPVSRLNRPAQRAYWINFYNALTVDVVLRHYPVRSIREIDISPGWFSRGPWGAKLVTVEGEALSLDDIEHRILRPIWRDPRLHYAVNCASLGCPSLVPHAFTPENSERLLEEAARAYVNHPRGARFEGRTLHVSSIYVWFRADFGGSDAGVLRHLRQYATGALAARLADYAGGLTDSYDWSLNQ